MTANDLAKIITKREGKRLSLSIAQVKEVLGILAGLCANDVECTKAFVKLCEAKVRAAARAKAKLKKVRPETSLPKRLGK